MKKILEKISFRRLRRFTLRRRLVIIVFGVVILASSLIFTNSLARQLRQKELNEVEMWHRTINSLGGNVDPNSAELRWLVNPNNSIPFIIVDDHMHVVISHLIPQKILDNPELLRRKIIEMGAKNKGLEIFGYFDTYYIYFGESSLLKTLLYFPYVQIGIILVFLVFTYLTFSSTKQNEQNRVWIGLAKETAHQLGTPISSLLGWVEYLRARDVDQRVVEEMNNDLVRLTKVVDRFSKIGSETSLSEYSINEVVGASVMYFRTRIPKNVRLTYNGLAMAPQKAMLNEALFEWVVENLLKNALDALSGVGSIDVVLSDDDKWVYIDVKDSGKGILKSNFKTIFQPGFTTKTRGWGLGLSLSKRIMEDYHRGRIFVLESEPDKGTTMRIAVRKIYP